jgi:Anti-sigma-K factor rskA
MRDEDDLPELPPAVRARLGDPAVWAEPPAQLEADVLMALRRAREEPDATAAPDGGPPADSDELTRARERRAARRGTRWVIAAAASVVVIGLLLGGGLLLRDDGSPPVVAALSGTQLAPGAGGQVRVSSHPSGFEIRLDIDGLAPAPEGTYYQGWLKGPSGLVTVGTFHAREGADDIVLWSGVDIDDYPELTVTLQREGAGPESSGRVVLRAAVG